jgi:hypothetical protein
MCQKTLHDKRAAVRIKSRSLPQLTIGMKVDFKNNKDGLVSRPPLLLRQERLYLRLPAFFIFPRPKFFGFFAIGDITIRGVAFQDLAGSGGNVGQMAE